jgi:transcriptional regulator
MKDYKKILQLNSEGKSKNEISQCLGYQWRTVSDILKKAEEAKTRVEDLRQLLLEPDTFMDLNLGFEEGKDER